MIDKKQIIEEKRKIVQTTRFFKGLHQNMNICNCTLESIHL